MKTVTTFATTGAAVIALVTLGAGAVLAAEPSQSAAVNLAGASSIQRAIRSAATRSKIISLSDLDLSSPAGARAAHERLHTAARTLCAQVEDRDDLSKQLNFVICVDQAMAAALAQIQSIASIGRAKSSVAKN